MSDMPTHAMVDAAFKAAPAHCRFSEDDLPATLAAALAAAPTVDGWVWCGFGQPYNLVHMPDDDCPGPHRALIPGSTVEVTP